MCKSYLKLRYFFLVCVTVAVTVFGMAGHARAAEELGLFPNMFDKFSADGSFSVYYRYDSNIYLGAEEESQGGDPERQGETVTKVGFTFEKKLSWADLEGRVSAILMTEFDYRSSSSYEENDSQNELDEGFLNFRKINQSPFSLKVGRQNVFIEKRFIMADASPSIAGVWDGSFKSFPLAVRVDGDFGQLKTTAFWGDVKLYEKQADQRTPSDDPLENKGTKGISFAGINLHYDFSDTAFLYGGYYRKIDNSNAVFSNFSPDNQDLLGENNTNAFDIGVDVEVKPFHFTGEFVYQTGDAGRFVDNGDDTNGLCMSTDCTTKNLERDAYAGFVEARYNFDHPKKPHLSAMYAFYSGDKDLEDDKAEDYDPMLATFYDWNRWFIGEHIGNEILFNISNKHTFLVETGFKPMPEMQLTFVYMKHFLDEPYKEGSNAANTREALLSDDTDLADEFNLLLDYTVNEHLYVHFSTGYSIPDDAAKEFAGGDKDNFFAQTLVTISF